MDVDLDTMSIFCFKFVQNQNMYEQVVRLHF